MQFIYSEKSLFISMLFISKSGYQSGINAYSDVLARAALIYLDETTLAQHWIGIPCLLEK